MEGALDKYLAQLETEFNDAVDDNTAGTQSGGQNQPQEGAVIEGF